MIKKIRILLIVIICFLIIISLDATILKKVGLEEKVKVASTIVVGECVKKETKWVSGRIETTVTIKSTEYLKGNKGEEFKVTLLGGAMKEPVPITQYIPGQAFFYEGEKVMLFLEDHKPITQPIPEKYKESGLITTPIIIGLYQGKYSIITDKKTGEEKAVQINWSMMGRAPEEFTAKKIVEILENAEKSESVKMKYYSTAINLEEFKKKVIGIIEKQEIEQNKE